MFGPDITKVYAYKEQEYDDYNNAPSISHKRPMSNRRRRRQIATRAPLLSTFLYEKHPSSTVATSMNTTAVYQNDESELTY